MRHGPHRAVPSQQGRRPTAQLKMRHTLYIILSAAVILSACTGRTVYDKYLSTPVEGWERSDTLTFSIPKLTGTGRYRQEIGLRINGAYPFTAVSLLVEQTVEPGHRVTADTINCRLYDSKGNHLGNGVSYFQYSFILSDTELQKGDSLNIRVRHIMRRETLPGISDIGFKMTRK